MNEPSIQVDKVSRLFDAQPVIQNLSFSVKQGSIYGFLGRNGSGKTTTIRMLAGLIKPTTGTVRIRGNDPFTIGAKERQWLGYMSEKAVIPPYCSVRNVLQLGRSLYPSWDSALVGRLLAKYDLSLNKRFMTLSQGNQRLLNFIMAIAPRPKVLLLDEPAANLDVVARREILDDILALVREYGCTVILSTHILSDVERIADEIGIIAKGTLCMSESVDSLKDSIRQVRFFGFKKEFPGNDIPECLRVLRGKDELTLTMRTGSQVTPEMLGQKWSCQHESRTLNLEDLFVELSSSNSNSIALSTI